jgi:hypothetical protein
VIRQSALAKIWVEKQGNQNLDTNSNAEERKMSPSLHQEIWVSDVESIDSDNTPRQSRGLIPQTGTLLVRHLKHLSDRLVKCKPRGNRLPKLGQLCLIMKGKAGCDEGQMGIVSDRTAAMVHVTYASDRRGGQTSKLKRPSSLIMLDPSLTVIQEKDGAIWIRPIDTVESRKNN